MAGLTFYDKREALGWIEDQRAEGFEAEMSRQSDGSYKVQRKGRRKLDKDQSTLQDILNESGWYTKRINLLTAAQILDRKGAFGSLNDVYRFFENPTKWDKTMREIVRN